MVLDGLVNTRETDLVFRPCEPSLLAGISILSKKYQVFSPAAQAFRDMATIGSDLESLQKTVGGSIEAAYFYDDPIALICNEEGKLNGMPLNRAVKDENGEIMHDVDTWMFYKWIFKTACAVIIVTNTWTIIMEIFRSKEFGSVRVLKDGDKYLFCGSDVAKALGYARPNDALSRHCRYTAKRSIPAMYQAVE